MAYLLVTLSWGGRVHGGTREHKYEDDLYDRVIYPEEKDIAQTVDEKRRSEVYQEEDLPNLNDYRLQDQDLRRGKCGFKSNIFKNGCLITTCNKGCRLTCAK